MDSLGREIIYDDMSEAFMAKIALNEKYKHGRRWMWDKDEAIPAPITKIYELQSISK